MKLSESVNSENAQLHQLHHLLTAEAPTLVGTADEQVNLPQSLRELLLEAVQSMQSGRAFSIVPSDEHLSTQEVADMLSVSRPHVVKLLDTGKIPSHKAGTHRRVCAHDALAYLRARDAERRTILADLARKAYEEGLYANAVMPVGGNDE